MPDKTCARARFEARAIAYGLDIARHNNGDDYDSDETQRYWLGFCWALGLAKEITMEIDWSIAPEGATHWAPETDKAHEGWYKKRGNGWMVFSKGTGYEWREISFPKRNLSELTPRPADPAAKDHRHEQPATAEQTGLPPGTKRVMESPMSNEELRRAIEATAFDLDEPAGYAPGVVDMLKQHLQRLLDIEAARAACVLVEVDDCADAAQGVK